MEKSEAKAGSLSERLSELSNPRPVEFHPDQDDWDLLTAARLSRHSGVDLDRASDGNRGRERGVRTLARASSRHRRLLEREDEPRYAGKSVSRKNLEAFEEEEEG